MANTFGLLTLTIQGKHYCACCGRRFKTNHGTTIHLNTCEWFERGIRNKRGEKAVARYRLQQQGE